MLIDKFRAVRAGTPEEKKHEFSIPTRGRGRHDFNERLRAGKAARWWSRWNCRQAWAGNADATWRNARPHAGRSEEAAQHHCRPAEEARRDPQKVRAQDQGALRFEQG